MEYAMTKKALDRWGGVGSIFAGIVCIWFAQQHHEHESIWKVWVGMCVLLMLNGMAMIVHAQRAKDEPRIRL
jgi:hypothetical protein